MTIPLRCNQCLITLPYILSLFVAVLLTVLGEGDLVYTQTLCRIGEEDYRNKTILVLGGGDGAILHELLKESPRFITMAEIGKEYSAH